MLKYQFKSRMSLIANLYFGLIATPGPVKNATFTLGYVLALAPFLMERDHKIFFRTLELEPKVGSGWSFLIPLLPQDLFLSGLFCLIQAGLPALFWAWLSQGDYPSACKLHFRVFRRC